MVKFINFIRKIILRILGMKYPINIQLEELKKKGLIVGENFSMQEDVLIDGSHCFLINIGDNVTLAPRVHILAHDASTKMHIGYSKIGRVIIGNNVFIGANTTILPNVKIGDNVIVGANSLITKDIPSGVVCVGNPMKIISSIDKYILKNNQNIKKRPVYSNEYSINKITYEMKEEMLTGLKDGIGYLE
ncbi:acyltransferase [Clostridium perfringens]